MIDWQDILLIELAIAMNIEVSFWIIYSHRFRKFLFGKKPKKTSWEDSKE